MDNVLVDFQSGLASLPAAMLGKYAGHEDDIPGIFTNTRSMRGAIESFTEFAGLFDAYILSTAPWENPSAWSDKVLWVQQHLGEVAYKRLILTHHKDLSRGDFLIDDRVKHGVDRFQGEHIHFGSEQYPDWPAVMTYLRTRADQIRLPI
ncbi:MAG: 5' nucleotidase, NT5C type [Candidatus Acidiferrales bacterium]